MTGRSFFYIDETGVLSMRACGADGPHDDPGPPFSMAVWPPESENCSCPREGDVARPIITQLLLLAPVDVVREAAQWGASSKNVERTLLALDSNSDKKLTLDEIVEADLLAIARELAAESKLPAGPAIGHDRDLAEVLSRYRAAMKAGLFLGAADEDERASLPLQSFSGDPSKWLQTAPQLPIGMLSDQSTRALSELTNLAIAENLAVLGTGTCTEDTGSLWAFAPFLRIPGNR